MFQTASIIKKVESMADGGWKLRIDTQELTPAQVSEVALLKDKYGYFLFKENTIIKDEIPEDEAPEFQKDKSLSQRFRDVLYVYWKQKIKPKSNKTFVQFRTEYMEKKIQEIKDNLD